MPREVSSYLTLGKTKCVDAWLITRDDQIPDFHFDTVSLQQEDHFCDVANLDVNVDGELELDMFFNLPHKCSCFAHNQQQVANYGEEGKDEKASRSCRRCTEIFLKRFLKWFLQFENLPLQVSGLKTRWINCSET